MPDPATYTNPVYPGSFADPFVLRHGDWYYAYGTNDVVESDRAFEVLRSRDLVTWDSLGRCLTDLTGSARDHWAPEVASEGPFVVRRQGRLRCFYSGGAWTGAGYGVSYALADTPLGPWTEPVSGPALMRTREGALEGPGHNSIVVGPDGTDYLVYHAWDVGRTARRMCIDRLEWTPEGPRTAAPTITPQPVPALAA